MCALSTHLTLSRFGCVNGEGHISSLSDRCFQSCRQVTFRVCFRIVIHWQKEQPLAGRIDHIQFTRNTKHLKWIRCYDNVIAS